MPRSWWTAPALALLVSASACQGAAEQVDDAPEEDEEPPPAETDWEPREPESHASAQPRLVVAEADGPSLLVIDALSGDTIEEVEAEAPAELTVADPEGASVLLGDEAAELLDTGIRWEAHGGHYDPDNTDPELVDDDDALDEAGHQAEEDHFDTALTEITGDDTVTVTGEDGEESQIVLDAQVAAATWDPYWEQGLALTEDGVLHALDPEAGEVAHSAEVTDPFEGTAALAAGESHVYATNPETREVIEVQAERSGLERERNLVLDLTPGDLVVVGLEPLDGEYAEADGDHDHDDDHHDDEDDHDHDHDH